MPQITIEVPDRCNVAVFKSELGEHEVYNATSHAAQLQINDLARQLHVATGAELRMMSWTVVGYGSPYTIPVTNPPAPLKRPA